MKAELRVDSHKVLAGENVVEVWYGGRLVGTVVGADGPGIRFISRFEHVVRTAPMVTEVLSKGPETN